MSTQFLESSNVCSIITIFLISIMIPASHCADDEQFRNCSRPFNCGGIQGIGYPFWGGNRPAYCGSEGFELVCRHDRYPVVSINTQIFRVLYINQSIHVGIVARDDLWDNICPKKFVNTTSYYLYDNSSTVRNLNIFYGCTSEVMADAKLEKSNVTCPVNGGSRVYYAPAKSVSGVKGCNISIVVPILWTAFDELWSGRLTLQEALNQGFYIIYFASPEVCSACKASGGICGSDSTSQFVCLCRDKPHPHVCQKHGVNRMRKLIIGSSAAGIAVLVTCVIIICYCRQKKLSCKSIVVWMKKTKNDQNLEALIREYGSLAPKRYSYSDVKKMTNCFKDKLGQGGYGGVYKGNLLDGHLVAVKILNISKGNGEEFINEVASISRTSHVNVVTLLGFCLEGSKRALIYEFMPNGSLEKFVYGRSPLKTNEHLGWEKLYQIAIGIAQGLEYLHRGCNTRILHFDIKPHNILLDEDFCPKISDFGLAKLCTKKESIVSMLGARGTIGYIAPEVFSRNFGGVSHKSDVYSYGMMLLEMVGGRKNADAGVSHTSEAYFPHWVYKRLALDEDLELPDVMTNEENEIVRKMMLVGLWCIQTDPSERPSMSKVIDMLEASIEALEIPPKPFLCSPTRSAENSLPTSGML